MRRERLLDLAEIVAGGSDVEVTKRPAAGTLMLQLGCEVGEFCLGEVVVTQAAVRVGGAEGWACVMGWDEEAALAAALLDAAPSTESQRLAADALDAEAASRAAEARAVAATRVGRS